MLSTDIPSSEVDRFIDLALKARSQRVASLSLVPPMINTGDPDIDLVQEKVAAAIDTGRGTGAPAEPQEEEAPGGHRRFAGEPQRGVRRQPGRRRRQRLLTGRVVRDVRAVGDRRRIAVETRERHG